jgi:2'-5' RNA ligase
MSQKYVIVHFIDKYKVPNEFPATKWPLHVTLLANFTITKHLEDLRAALKSYSQNCESFNIVAHGETLFGPKQNIGVSLIQPNDDIKQMHAALSEIASNFGAVFDEPAFMGEGFRPHATIQINSRLTNNQTVSLTDFTLVDMYPNEDINRRRIIETYTFQK